MKSASVLFVLASVAIVSGVDAAPSVHKITKATGKHYCGKDAELSISIVAPKGAHGTLRVEPVAASHLAQNVSYKGNGTTVSVPVKIAGLGCADVKGIKLNLDDGQAWPTWLMPNRIAYGVAKAGASSTTHIERVEAVTSGGHTQFELLLFGGTDRKNLHGTIRVRSVHSGAAQPGERTTTYDVEAGKAKTHTFGHSFSSSGTLTAFNVYLNGASPPLVASRRVVSYSL
jgi:hypothetical protein